MASEMKQMLTLRTLAMTERSELQPSDNPFLTKLRGIASLEHAAVAQLADSIEQSMSSHGGEMNCSEFVRATTSNKDVELFDSE
mmetsp:Transcript_6504/g.7603  ORF Transcript_6504/g.7603 Transcript_6504/m.7603 type:complete len:84 (+) Transcript_6504:1186-1437(+)|eukprot:CAMPEP_0185575846 /NCGR_PEP_ID=MMETSP0434-20130131/6923_1 /TAXON_ID=626734 ORGANISM="Favella taraikaensis, Strain Fe Narragansett Bay" /NCGR_SAMPLE_ID=MMETSP0434 /ASSEMBLY_ACC=CAM_ASM_000379 /LENGTH=83 /DNA_ID=CAMNT_0028192841 /DNA_START=2293 /DNA_END=2544 /DNA_ORIENTATION=+